MADIDDVFAELHRIHERLDEIRMLVSDANTIAGRFRDRVIEVEARVSALEAKSGNGSAHESYL